MPSRGVYFIRLYAKNPRGENYDYTETEKEKIRAGRVPLGDKITVSGDEAGFVAEFISEFYPAKEGNGKITFARDGKLNTEAYTIKSDGSVEVRFSDRLGARNAASSLVQLIGKDENGFFLPVCEIKDAPDCGFRSVLIDLARGIPDMKRLKEDLRRLALFKCNHVHLHLMDAQGTCYVSSVLAFNGQINGTDRCDKSYLREINDYCEKLGIEVIPEIEIPSHASGLWHLDPKIRCVTDLPDPSPACICAGSEHTYEIFHALSTKSAMFSKENISTWAATRLCSRTIPTGIIAVITMFARPVASARRKKVLSLRFRIFTIT